MYLAYFLGKEYGDDFYERADEVVVPFAASPHA